MKKKLLLIIFVLTLGYSTQAKKIEGQIFFIKDTLTVTFEIPVNIFTQEINYMKLQKKVKYYDSVNKIIELNPDQAVEIRFKYEYENIRMISLIRTGDLSSSFALNPNVFLKLVIDGKLKVFCYYYNKQGFVAGPPVMGSSMSAPRMTTMQSTSYGADQLVLKKEDGTIKWPNKFGFRKDMKVFFADCPKLVDKIEKKEYSRDDLESIARFYNSNCGGK